MTDRGKEGKRRRRRARIGQYLTAQRSTDCRSILDIPRDACTCQPPPLMNILVDPMRGTSKALSQGHMAATPKAPREDAGKTVCGQSCDRSLREISRASNRCCRQLEFPFLPSRDLSKQIRLLLPRNFLFNDGLLGNADILAFRVHSRDLSRLDG